jgi:DNA (cytosine-5)-methyltransferase 1
MSRPRLLDLFCCAGGAGMGYHLAGFDVTGVDIDAQPDYPFTFHHGDALTFVAAHGHEFDAIHASPPCQAHSPVSHLSRRTRRRELPDLLPQTRAVLLATGRPYVIENVHTRSAALAAPLVLCGAMFGLDIYRHRGFETSLPLLAIPPHPRHNRRATRNGYLPTPDAPVMTITGRNGHHAKAWQRKAAEVMGTPWITGLNQICEAIPPAYTRFLGEQLHDHLTHDTERRTAA